MSIPYLIATFLFPLVGLIVDKFGHRINLLFITPFLITIAFVLLPSFYPTWTFSLLGLSYAIFGAVVWPTVAYIVP